MGSVQNRYSRLTPSFATTPIVDLAPVMFLCLLGIFEPEFIRQVHPSLHNLFKLLQRLSYLIAVASLFRWRRVPGILVFALGLMSTALLTQLLTAYPSIDSVWGIISQYIKIGLSLSLLVYWVSNDAGKFFGIASFLLASLALANLASEILRPDGLYMTGWTHVPCYVFGHKNMVVPAMIPGLICVAGYEGVSVGRPRALTGFYILLLILNALFSRSSTALAVVALVLLLAIVMRCFSGFSFGPVTVFTGETVAMILLVFLKVQEQFANLIFKLFKKSVTFSSRTEIWDKWVALFEESPIIGVGNLPQELLRSVTKGVNAHETWLGILATGGLIRLSVYLAGAFALWRFMRPVKRDAIVRLGMVGLAAFAVVGLMEAMDMNTALLQSLAVLEGYIAYCRFAEHPSSSNRFM